VYEGERIEGPVGGHDDMIVLIDRYHWTPEEICRMDDDLLAEILIRDRAAADVAREAREKAEKEAEAEKKKREREAARADRERKSGLRGENVQLSEIS
jgi:hypothetical protein